jgi:hypothetical protein
MGVLLCWTHALPRHWQTGRSCARSMLCQAAHNHSRARAWIAWLTLVLLWKGISRRETSANQRPAACLANYHLRVRMKGSRHSWKIVVKRNLQSRDTLFYSSTIYPQYLQYLSTIFYLHAPSYSRLQHHWA